MMGDEAVRGRAGSGAEQVELGSSTARQTDPWHPREYTLSVRRWEQVRRTPGLSLRAGDGRDGGWLIAGGGR